MHICRDREEHPAERAVWSAAQLQRKCDAQRTPPGAKREEEDGSRDAAGRLPQQHLPQTDPAGQSDPKDTQND